MAYLFCVVIPSLALLGRRTYEPGHWTYYLLPVLSSLALVKQSLRLLKRFQTVLFEMPFACLLLDELRECYWALAQDRGSRSDC